MFYLINAQLTSAGTLKSARYAWLITDNTGTPLIALDDQGKPLWKGTRDAFAAVVPAADSQITVNLRYAGQYADAETGLYYNGFRYYDPLTGRYLQPDPLGLSGGLNSYAYALNNPLRYIDPEGQNPVAILLIWTGRLAVGWAIGEAMDYLIGYLPDNECNPLLSPQRWVNAASYAIGISAAQKGVKALTAVVKLRRGLGGAGKGTKGTTSAGQTGNTATKPIVNPATNTVVTDHIIVPSGKAPKTSTPNSVYEVSRADGSKSITYYDSRGNMFSREDYGQQSAHKQIGIGSDGRATPHEHKVEYNAKGQPIGKYYREIDKDGKAIGDWINDKKK